MKKSLVLILAIAIFTLAACGQKADNEPSDTAAETNANIETAADDAGAEQDDNNTADSSATLGQTLLADFFAKAEANPEATAQELADEIISNKIILFDGAVMPVEEGYLTGFDNAEIKGFKEGVMFSPMISTIPFVGYIFILEDGADVDGFIANLKENANLRWNICTEAEEMAADHVNNTVFFLMCPKSLGEE